MKANLSEDPKSRLSEEELSAQMRYVTIGAVLCVCVIIHVSSAGQSWLQAVSTGFLILYISLIID